MRKSGILMHISSLPSKYGIGKLGKQAYKFIDFLAETRTGLWQILPLSPTSYGDSPYQSFSAFAGNPYFIDFEILEEEGLLESEDYKDIDWEHSSGIIDYEFLYKNVYDVLKKAFARFIPDQYYKLFLFKNRDWLDDYALFMAIKFHYNGMPWYKWPESIAMCDEKAIEQASAMLSEDIEFFKFIQYMFRKQWDKIKDYANNKNIRIIGDIPIYVSHDSVEVWRNPELFFLDKEKQPVAVAGCPPDIFSPTGQLWGNPLYNWKYHKKTDYEWWIRRLKNASETYDIIRIDHFRGFESYYCIPYGNPTAEAGIWMKGPDSELFEKAEEELGKLDVIAENLGFITPEVQQMLDRTGYPGMKVVEFGFDGPENSYLPHNFTGTNDYIYTGTHDNDTLKGWYSSLDEKTLSFCKEYLNVKNDNEIADAVLRIVWSGISEAAVAQFQDFVGADTDCRMNTPSTLSGNWSYRTKESDFTEELKSKILRLNTLFNRCAEIAEEPETDEENIVKEENLNDEGIDTDEQENIFSRPQK